MKTRNLTIIFVILVVILAGIGYWYFFLGGNGTVDTSNDGTDTTNTGFQPIDRTIPGLGGSNTTPGTDEEFPITIATTSTKIPTLRLLSSTPVGGFGASTTATTTIVRWVDRGRGNIYEANNHDLNVVTLSNTVVPMVYTSAWNKNLTAFIGSIYDKDTDTSEAIYAEIKKRNPTSTISSTSPVSNETFTDYELKGKNLPDSTIGFAVSPKKDRIFILTNESGSGVGYISGFDGKNATKIFDTPLTQLNVDWPEENTIVVTTKGAANASGYAYFVDPKTGVWKKVFGPFTGLATKVSHDASKIFISGTGANGSIRSIIYDTKKNTSIDAVIRTLAEKCVWGNFDKEMLYCATPSKIDQSVYPDNWYTGSVSFIDKIWQINTNTEEVHLVSQIINQADRVIDAFNLELDSGDNYLFFMNKNDLSLWSLDLVSSN